MTNKTFEIGCPLSCRPELNVSAWCLLAVFFGLLSAPVSSVLGDETPGQNHAASAGGFRVGAWRNWFFVSFLPEGTEAETLGLETESYFPLGDYEVKNISYLEGADYPRPIPGQPPGNTAPGFEIEAGINDLLTGQRQMVYRTQLRLRVRVGPVVCRRHHPAAVVGRRRRGPCRRQLPHGEALRILQTEYGQGRHIRALRHQRQLGQALR